MQFNENKLGNGVADTDCREIECSFLESVHPFRLSSPSHYFFPEIRRRRRPSATSPTLPPQIPLPFALPSASLFRPEAGLEGQSKVA